MHRYLLPLIVLISIALPTTLRADDAPDFTRFAGPWIHHAGVMTVDSAGVVWFMGNSFSNPRNDPPHVIAQLQSVSFDTAYGYGTSDGSPYWISLIPAWDSVIVANPEGVTPWTIMCGANVPSDVLQMLLRAGLAGASGCG